MHLLGGVYGPEPQHGGLADKADQLVLLNVRHSHDDLVVAGCGYFRLADTRLWMIVLASCRLLGSTVPLPVVFWAVKVIVVPPLRSRPSFGVQIPLTASKVISPATNTANTIRVRPG